MEADSGRSRSRPPRLFPDQGLRLPELAIQLGRQRHLRPPPGEISANGVRTHDQGIYTDEDSHDAQLLGNWIHNNGQGVIHQSHGIYLQGNDHLVANNVIHDHVKGFGIQVYDRNSRSINTATTCRRAQDTAGSSSAAASGPTTSVAW